MTTDEASGPSQFYVDAIRVAFHRDRDLLQ